MLGPMLLTWHNLTHYARLMAALRAAIRADALASFVRRFERARSGAAEEIDGD